MQKFFITTLLIFLFIPNISVAQTQNVFINEIAWMGSLATAGQTVQQSANDEWIELFNPNTTEVSLVGWTIAALDGSPIIQLHGTIAPNGYLLLTRANSTVGAIPADIVYDFKNNSLLNTGEHLLLTDSRGIIVDEVNATSGWPAGNNTTKETMARTATKAWVNGPVGGTPKTANTAQQIQNPPPMPELELPPLTSPEIEKEPLLPTQTPAVQFVSTFTRTNDVIINELLPNPAGDDAQGEWIEIYNKGNESHDLSGWFLNAYGIPLGTIIAPNGYIVLERPETKVVLNNTAGTVQLLYPDNSMVDTVQYTEPALEDTAYALINDTWQWTILPTPAKLNIQTLPITSPKTDNNDHAQISKQNTVKTTPQNPATEIQTKTAQEFSAQISRGTSAVTGKRGVIIAAASTALILGAIAALLYKNGHLQNKKRD